MPKSSRTCRTCEHCGASYSKKEHFERHVRTHTHERPFDCQQCSSKFSRKDTLYRHIRKCHPDEDNGSTVAQEIDDATGRNTLQPPGIVSLAGDGDEVNDPFHNGDEHQPVPSSSINPSSDFEWHMDDALNLDPTFSIDDLYTFDPNEVNPISSAPWCTLLPSSRGLDVPPIQTNSAPSETPMPRQQSQTGLQWFTHIAHLTHPIGLSTQPSRAHTPTVTAEGEISRDALVGSLMLRQPAPNSALPSVRLLNRWIHVFTTRLWPVVPIVHLPTFQPARTHPLLFLSICSLGALADGSKEALYYAEKIFEGVQKAILAAFTPDLAFDKRTLAMVQAAVIGQTFALLSGKAEHLLTAQAFHGTLFIITRKFYMSISGSRPSADLGPDCFQAQDWSKWIVFQTAVRLFNAVHVHNGEIAAITQQPASHRTHPLSIPTAAPDDQFLAKTADEWLNLRRARPGDPWRPVFSNSAVLEGFGSEISHARCSPFSVMSDRHIDEYQTALQAWFSESAESFRADRVQRTTMLNLWHSCFLLLLCNINLIERACGRDGCSISNSEAQELRAWMPTPRAKQCIAHASLMYRLLDDVRLCDVPAAHVARSLWHAGLVLAVYSSLALTHSSNGAPTLAAELYPGIESLRQNGFLTAVDVKLLEDDVTPTRCSTLASLIATSLRHLGPWPIAAHYATTFDQVLTLNLNDSFHDEIHQDS